jgi:hypothetical protein
MVNNNIALTFWDSVVNVLQKDQNIYIYIYTAILTI